MFEMLGNLKGELEIPNAGEMSALCSHTQQNMTIPEPQFHFLTNAEAQKYGLGNKLPGFKTPHLPLQNVPKRNPSFQWCCVSGCMGLIHFTIV